MAPEVNAGNPSFSTCSRSRPAPEVISPLAPNALYTEHITSPNVAETTGSSRSWYTITAGPGRLSKLATCWLMLAYTSPERGGDMLRNVEVTAKPTIGGIAGK